MTKISWAIALGGGGLVEMIVGVKVSGSEPLVVIGGVWIGLSILYLAIVDSNS